jgi:hypothetical protein
VRNFIQGNVQAFAGGKTQETSLTCRRERAKIFRQGKYPSFLHEGQCEKLQSVARNKAPESIIKAKQNLPEGNFLETSVKAIS